MTSTAPRHWDTLVAAGTVLLALGLPWSTSMVSIGGGLLAIAFLLRPGEVREVRSWHEPVMAVGLALFLFIAIRTLVSDASSDGWRRINQYHELLLAPVLLTVWRDPKHRRLFLACFIAACAFVALRLWASHVTEYTYKLAQRQRISASFAMAVAAYFLLLRAPSGPRKWPWVAGAAFFALTILFGIDGRTGLVVLFLLAACAAWVVAPRGWRVAAAVGVPAALIGAALLSPGVQGRIGEMQAAWHSTQVPNEADSSGVRLQILRITGEAMREHWLGGVGYSQYAQAHRAAAETVYAGMPQGQAFLQGFWTRLNNPHSEYVLQLVGGGIIALALFLAWLVAALWHARRMHSATLAGLVLAFAAGCAVNSMLLDFIEGHLYVALLAWVIAEHRFAPQPDAFRRIAVVATRQIGDVLLATPLIRNARERWPHAQIDVIGFQGTLGMLRGNADVNELIESRAGTWGGFGLLWTIIRRYDLALVTDVGDRAHLIAFVAARHRSGVVPETNPSNWWKRMLLDHVVVAAGDRGAKHVAVEKQELLAPWMPERGAPQVQAPRGGVLPQSLASHLEDDFVVVHAPSMWPYKQWPVAHFEQLVRELVAQGHQVVLTGTRGARDQECIAPLRPIEGVLDASGQLDFNQLVTLLQQAALYIGPDTSVSHLAAATGVPVIAIFGPTNPLRWAPLAPDPRTVTIIQSALHCVPCGRAGCEDHRQSRSDCLVDISPRRVMEEATRLLSA
ncbi:MAG TPA: glycosyltransferase family 9 protein [Ramlibacter sp.]|nr:glycosyltransferase family 9 protein [Ramlibacter sp.]